MDFKKGLLAAPAIIFYSLFSFHACLLTGCSTDTTDMVVVVQEFRVHHHPYFVHLCSTDSTGRGGGEYYPYRLQESFLPGHRLCWIVLHRIANCIIILFYGQYVSAGGVRRLILGTIPVDIPANTNLELRSFPKEILR